MALLYVLCSVTLAETAQRINGTKNWNKPILTGWFNHLCLVFLWPVLMVQACIGKDKGVFSRVKAIVWRLTLQWQNEDEKRADWKRFLEFVVFLSTLLFLAAGLWIVGLQHASVTDMQAMQQLIPVFTIIFAFVMMLERASWMKLLAVTISLTGVALFAFTATSDDSKGMDIWGVILGCSNAAGFALYCVVVKKVFGAGLDLDATVVVLFFIGVTSLFPVSLLLLICEYAGLEHFGLPGDWNTLGVLCLEATLSVATNLTHLGAIGLNGPTFTNIFAISQIAIAAIIDYVLDGTTLTFWEWVGCSCIIIGFIVTVVEGYLCFDAVKDGGYEEAPEADYALTGNFSNSEGTNLICSDV